MIRRPVGTCLCTVFIVLGVSVSAGGATERANELSEREQADGWSLLFDGTSTNGWRGVNKASFPAKGWRVVDGTIQCTGDEGGSIVTVGRYGNFELAWEWKLVTPGANSGVKYFVRERPGDTGGYGFGIEYQLLDSPETNKGSLGSAYDLIAASPDREPKPLGQWNRSRILSLNGSVEHWLNGRKILSYDRFSDAFERCVASSKFKNEKQFGRHADGHILLQDHSSQAFFRNIKIRVLAASAGSSSQSPAAMPLRLETHADIVYQTIDGFGASDAWRAQFVGKNWPIAKRNRIADLLFSREDDEQGNPQGIGLSLWRFYLSAGTAEQGEASDIGNPWRRGECFLKADGSYDWNRHEGQRWFLRAAKERGVEKLLAFPNSPPVHYTRNGKGFAPKGVIHLNLKPGTMDDYARYLADVMEHFDDEGIFFDYLSPVNEPQWDWDGNGQEGTPALNEEIHSLVRYLSHELSSRGLKTRIVIGEAGTIGHAAIRMDTLGQKSDGRDDQARFFFDEASPFYIGDLPNVEKTLSAHSYHSVWPIDKQVENRIRVGHALKQANPDLGYWMSEYCILQRNGEIGRGGGRDLTMKTALYVARILHHDMVLTHAKSWQWWTAITQCDYKDGLVYLDDGSRGDSGRMGGHVESLQHDGVVRDSKLLWVLGNYSRFIRPGMVRIQCELTEEQSAVDGLLVSAYQELAKEQVVYVLTNLSSQAKHVIIGPDRQARTYTTDRNNNLSLAYQSLNRIRIPERAVVTVVN
jgi:O-glycosyl hydrolase